MSCTKISQALADEIRRRLIERLRRQAVQNTENEARRLFHARLIHDRARADIAALALEYRRSKAS